MSSVKAHPSGQNLFMVVVRFLETFVGSMSAGQSIKCSVWVVVQGRGEAD